MTTVKLILSVLGTLAIMFALSFLLSFLFMGEDLFLRSFFGVRSANVERNIYEQSHSYNKGMVQELQSMQFDYEKTTDPKAKAALAGIILHRAGDISESQIPSDLYSFIQDLKK